MHAGDSRYHGERALSGEPEAALTGHLPRLHFAHWKQLGYPPHHGAAVRGNKPRNLFPRSVFSQTCPEPVLANDRVFIAAVFIAAKKLNTMRCLVVWLPGCPVVCRYARADIACDHGVVDWSGFTFLEIAKAAGSATLGHRYMEALAYFRTGLKGQIPSGI